MNIEETLKELQPLPPTLDRDAMMYEMGRQSVRQPKIWKSLVLVLLLCQIMTVIYYQSQPEPLDKMPSINTPNQTINPIPMDDYEPTVPDPQSYIMLMDYWHRNGTFPEANTNQHDVPAGSEVPLRAGDKFPLSQF